MTMTEAEYRERRRSSTVFDIERAKKEKGGLKKLLAQRDKLAEIYAEDGAHTTARTISEIDIPLIRAAIAAG